MGRQPEYRHWRVTIKERWMINPMHTELRGPYDKADVIKHYGLEQPDVEWYTLTEVKEGLGLGGDRHS